jgi:hypothetical protein
LPERPTERQVVDWLTILGRLVAANMPPDEASTRLRAYTPELLARYDSRDFTQVSREFVARHCKFFPSYGELCELLDKWPKPAANPLPQAGSGDSLDQMDRAWIARWNNRKAEAKGGDLSVLASLIRQQSPKAWAVISGTAGAVQREPTEAEVAAVHDAVQRAVSGMQEARLEQQQHRVHQGFEGPPKPPRDVTMKGEELRKSRLARGLKVPEPVP